MRSTAEFIAEAAKFEGESGYGWKASDLVWEVDLVRVGVLLDTIGQDAVEHVERLAKEMTVPEAQSRIAHAYTCDDEWQAIITCDHEGRVVEVWDGWHRIAAIFKEFGFIGVVAVLVGRQV